MSDVHLHASQVANIVRVHKRNKSKDISFTYQVRNETSRGRAQHGLEIVYDDSALAPPLYTASI